VLSSKIAALTSNDSEAQLPLFMLAAHRGFSGPAVILASYSRFLPARSLRWQPCAQVSHRHYASAHTPPSIIRAINRVVIEGTNAPDTVKVLAVHGKEVVAPVTPEQVKAKFDREYAELEKLVKALNITMN
jgi:hypothetical protein